MAVAAGGIGLLQQLRAHHRAYLITNKMTTASSLSEEAVACDTDVIATGCPFCYIMMDDGVKEIGADEQVIVQDIAMLLADRSLD